MTAPAGRDGVPPLAVGLLLAIGVLWGCNWPAMKLALGELSPWTFRAGTVTLAAVALMALARVMGERFWPDRALWSRLVALSLVNVTGWNMFSAFGIALIPGSHAALVAYTMPLWAALLSSLLLAEAIPRTVWIAIAAGLAGILILLEPDLHRFGDAPAGALLMIAAAMCWALGTVLIKRTAWGMGAIALTGWQLVIGGAPILIAWAIIEPVPDLARLSTAGLLATLYAGLVALVFCFAAFNKVITLVPASVAAVGTLLIPVVGVTSSHLLLAEPLGWREVVALACVLMGLVLVLMPPRWTLRRGPAKTI